MKNKELKGVLALTITAFICTTILYWIQSWIGV